jgi:hypothetical protein
MKSFAHARRLALAVVLAHVALGLGDYTLAVSPVSQWTALLSGGSKDDASGVAVDGLGNVYITGSTNGLLGQGRYDTDMYVSRFDSQGTRMWTRQFDEVGDGHGRSVSADGLGNVFVGGYSYVDAGALSPPGGILDGDGGATIGLLIKLDIHGGQEWNVELTQSSIDSVMADGNGNVLVTGFCNYTLGDLEEEVADLLLSKYNSEGAQLWATRVNLGGHDSSLAITTDKLGNIFIGGFTENAIGERDQIEDAFLRKYDADGQHLWTKQLDVLRRDRNQALAADGEGNVYAVGYSGQRYGPSTAFLTKYDGAGEILWTRDVTETVLQGVPDGAGLAVDHEGNVYTSTTVSAQGIAGNTREVLLSKFRADGEWLWDHTLEISGSPSALGLALDQLGSVYLVGNTNVNHGVSNYANYDAFLAKVHDPTAATHVIPEPRSFLIAGFLAAAFLRRYRLRAANLLP